MLQRQLPTEPTSATNPLSSPTIYTPVLEAEVVQPPEVAAIQNAVGAIQRGIQDLGNTFSIIGHEGPQPGLLEELAIAKELAYLRKQMKAQDKKQDDALLAVQKLLQEVLENDVVDHLKSEVEAQIAAVIDKEVEEQVKLQLDYHLSQTLQDEIENYRRQIETAQRDLVNSESRRANSVLEKPKDLVHPVYGPNGEVSKKYPKDLQALFNIDGNTAKELVIEYQIGAVSTSRNVNLNMFMRHIGVAFQLMSAGPDQPSIPVKINRHNGIVAAL